MGNERLSQILQAEVAMTLVRSEHTSEGAYMRRFYDLALARDHTPIFAMSFLAMHTMDQTSPLFGATRQTLQEMEAEILVTVTGLTRRWRRPSMLGCRIFRTRSCSTIATRTCSASPTTGAGPSTTASFTGRSRRISLYRRDTVVLRRRRTP
jgi:hypothetical protein